MNKVSFTNEKVTGNLSGYLHQNACRNPGKLAFLHPMPITFAEIDRKVDQLCHGLVKAGVGKGTRTIMLVNANSDFFILTFALLRIGAIPVMIDPGVGLRVMKNSLSEVDSEVFIGSPLAQLFRLLYRRAFRQIKLTITVGNGIFRTGTSYQSLFSSVSQPFVSGDIVPDDPGAIFFTSGSTGSPKGVIYLNRMFHAQIQYFRTYYRWNTQETDFCTFPLIGLFSLCLGMTVVIADINPAKPASLNPGKIWTDLEKFGCTHMFGSPMIIRRLSEYGHKNGKHLSNLSRIVTAGAPVPPELLKRMKELLPEQSEIHATYGATEALPVTDIERSELINIQTAYNFQSGICQGKPLPGISLVIIPITESAIPFMDPAIWLPDGEVGEIAVSGPVVTESYLYNSEADRQAKMRDSSGAVWHRMGDLGRLDKEGRLWFYGRKNHRVETSNGCLYTIPTEAVFNQIPEVIRTALVGIAGGPSGYQKPVICIQLAAADYWFKRKVIRRKLIESANTCPETAVIHTFLFRMSFPVDPRHNAKIFREKLARWAKKRVKWVYW